ncbi:potassium channel family protein, partial [Streptomyces sp. E2N166]|uniref:potassium channel family protein n=1 Tax=Streptomyces sp. E2N166 TaxID=1851909 RepID=UPI0012924C05
MEWLVSLVGAGLVMAALRDLFHTLWHPTRRRGVSRLVMTGLWRMSRHVHAREGAAGLVGPLALVTVVGMWAVAIILGWAMIYWPHMPEGFTFAPGLQAPRPGDLLAALYFSLVTVATLGLGDIAPAAGRLRIAAPSEALVGFALLTATVSWVLEIYPALTRRRVLALRLALLHRAAGSPRQLDAVADAGLLQSLATEVVRVRLDFTQYPESYYFHDGEDQTSLAAMACYATDLADQGKTAKRAEVQLAAAMLSSALKDLAAVLDQRFLRTGGSPMEI